jgi:hypothetical protein
MIMLFSSKRYQRLALKDLKRCSSEGTVWLSISLDSAENLSNANNYYNNEIEKLEGTLIKQDSIYILTFYPNTGGIYNGYNFKFNFDSDSIKVVGRGYGRFW